MFVLSLFAVAIRGRSDAIGQAQAADETRALTVAEALAKSEA
jgi:hypothetical protein